MLIATPLATIALDRANRGWPISASAAREFNVIDVNAI
jgi:hypothetical protein